MKTKRSELIVTFLVGFAASTISGGALIVLLVLMGLLVVGSLKWTSFEVALQWPENRLRHLWRHCENAEAAPIPRQACVLGVGHHAK